MQLAQIYQRAATLTLTFPSLKRLFVIIIIFLTYVYIFFGDGGWLWSEYITLMADAGCLNAVVDKLAIMTGSSNNIGFNNNISLYSACVTLMTWVWRYRNVVAHTDSVWVSAMENKNNIAIVERIMINFPRNKKRWIPMARRQPTEIHRNHFFPF